MIKRWLIIPLLGMVGFGFRTQVGQMLHTPDELPAQNCIQGKEDGLSYSDGVPTPSKAPEPLPFPKDLIIQHPVNIPEILHRGRTLVPRHFMPDELSLQPFEGYPEDIAKVGEVLRQADQGKRIRLTFFGASHTAGDFWTGHIRRVLQARYGDIGHGFVMPVAMSKGSRGSDLNLCSSGEWVRDYVGKEDGWGDPYYGLGMTVSSDDPSHFSWLETTHQNPIGRRFSQAHIFTLGQFGGGSLLTQIDRNPPLLLSTSKEEPQLLHTRIDLTSNAHRLTVSPAGDGTVRFLGVSIEDSGPGVLVDAIGIRGRQANTWLKWDDDLLRDMLSIMQPNIVVLAYGTNEANDSDYSMDNYERDLRAVLDKLKRVHPNDACILVGPSDRGTQNSAFIRKSDQYLVWERTQLVAEIQRRVSPDFGCVFWDWQQATGGVGSMIAWKYTVPALASADLIHFTAKGYQVSGDLFIQALDDAAEHFTTRPRKVFFRKKHY